MVDQMPKCKHRTGDWVKVRPVCNRSRWCGRCGVRQSVAAIITDYCPNGKWKTAFLRRYRGETAKLCQEDLARSGCTGCRGICCSVPVNSSKRKAVRMARPAVKSVSYTHLRAHETGRNLVCRLL